MPYYEIRYNPIKKLPAFCQSVIGRKPNYVRMSPSGDLIGLEFPDPPLTSIEETALIDALPDYIKNLYDISKKTGTLKMITFAV